MKGWSSTGSKKKMGRGVNLRAQSVTRLPPVDV